jgi:hypothetical protein
MWPLGTAGYAGCFTPPRGSFCCGGDKTVADLIAQASATICDAGIAKCVAVLGDPGRFDPSIRPHDIRNQPHHA